MEDFMTIALLQVFLYTHEIPLIWHSHPHFNFEVKTPKLLHCNNASQALEQLFKPPVFCQKDAVTQLYLLFNVHLQDMWG